MINKESKSGPIKVLHIDSASQWGGGQSQISTLILESKHLPLEHHLASPQNSKLHLRLRSNIAGFTPLSRSIIYGFSALLRIRNYCLKNRIQIIHAHCGKSHTYAYWLKRLFLKDIKIIVHRRIPAKVRSNFISKRKFLDPIVDHFICVSNYIKGVLLSAGVASSKISVVRSSKKQFSCTDSDKENARISFLRIPGLALGGDFFILSASRLVADKGLFVLIEAFRKFAKHRPSARLVIAGEGELEAELKLTAKSLLETGQIVFLGFRKDIPELLMGADLFAIPSLSEGLGSTIVEAMFARTTVVGSSVEGIPELISNDETGLLTPPGDAARLYEAFIRMADNPEERNQLASQAYKWAIDTCGSEIMVERTFTIYETILATV